MALQLAECGRFHFEMFAFSFGKAVSRRLGKLGMSIGLYANVASKFWGSVSLRRLHMINFCHVSLGSDWCVLSLLFSKISLGDLKEDRL